VVGPWVHAAGSWHSPLWLRCLPLRWLKQVRSQPRAARANTRGATATVLPVCVLYSALFRDLTVCGGVVAECDVLTRTTYVPLLIYFFATIFIGMTILTFKVRARVDGTRLCQRCIHQSEH